MVAVAGSVVSCGRSVWCLSLTAGNGRRHTCRSLKTGSQAACLPGRAQSPRLGLQGHSLSAARREERDNNDVAK